MDLHALEYYRPYSKETGEGFFHRVIALHDEPLSNWFEASTLAPCLCRGWYELAKLPSKDRIEFLHDFWLSKLPYHPDLNRLLDKFFSSLDDVGIFLTQKDFEKPFTSHLVYSLSDNRGFFHGEPGLNEEEIACLQKEFSDFMLPADYLAFLRLHNHFAKLKDTGILGFPKLKLFYDDFQKRLENEENEMAFQNTLPDPKKLIPFYQSFDLPFFQCFWAEWYPDQEMGNVYYSGSDRAFFRPKEGCDSTETMAFDTFTDWLLFYLETID